MSNKFHTEYCTNFNNVYDIFLYTVLKYQAMKHFLCVFY